MGKVKKINNVIDFDKSKKVLIEKRKYERVLSLLKGIAPKIITIGIIAAENFKNYTTEKGTNNRSSKNLNGLLRWGAYGYTKLTGRYCDDTEDYFLIRNIPKDDLLRIGNIYNRDSVIFGKRVKKGKYTGMKFELVLCKSGKVSGSFSVFIDLNNIKDFYFDKKGAEFFIPFFDEKYCDSEENTIERMTRTADEIDTVNLAETIDKMNCLTKRLFKKGYVGKYYYLNRGRIKLLQKLIDDNC